MEHRTTPRFWAAYNSLPTPIQARADQQFGRLKNNPRHPSLQLKKLGVVRDKEIWSARVTLDFRALAFKTGDDFIWFWIGDHKSYDSLVG